MRAALHQPACLERGHDAREGALGDPGLRRDDAGLGISPDPHHPEHDPSRPGQLVGCEHGALEVIADRVGRAVDVGDSRHGVHVDRQPGKALGHLSLGLEQHLGIARGVRRGADIAGQRTGAVVTGAMVGIAVRIRGDRFAVFPSPTHDAIVSGGRTFAPEGSPGCGVVGSPIALIALRPRRTPDCSRVTMRDEPESVDPEAGRAERRRPRRLSPSLLQRRASVVPPSQLVPAWM